MDVGPVGSHAAIWALVSKGGAPTTEAQGHCCPNARTGVPDPSASREDLSNRCCGGTCQARAACIISR